MNEERMYQVLLGAHISEKSTVIADEANQFAFRVSTDATKPEVKQAVEKIYSVNVESVPYSTLRARSSVRFAVQRYASPPGRKRTSASQPARI